MKDRYTSVLTNHSITIDDSLSLTHTHRIITAGEITNLVANQSAQVFKFDTAYSLSSQLTSDVSDHYPVEFQLQSTASGPVTVSFPGPGTDGALALRWSQLLSLFLIVLTAIILL